MQVNTQMYPTVGFGATGTLIMEKILGQITLQNQ